MLRLTGGAGTGKKILKNWDLFSFNLVHVEKDSNRIDYQFDVTFGKQNGTMLVIKEKKNDSFYISQSSILDMNFDRPLGFYNDTTGFDDGLYEVSRRMLLEI